ncbi:unnamed protein product [Calypogeia fissa]
MSILVHTTSFPRGSKIAVARNLCFAVLFWLCFAGHGFSVPAAARSYTDSRELNDLALAAAAELIATSKTEPSGNLYDLLVTTGTAEQIARSNTDSREVNDLAVAAAAELIATSKTEPSGTLYDLPVASTAELIATSKTEPSGTFYELPVTATAEPIARSSGDSKASDHQLSVTAGAQSIAKSKKSSRAVNTTAGRSTAKTSTGSTAIDKSSVTAAAKKPTARSKSGSKAGNRVAAIQRAKTDTGSKAGDESSVVAAAQPIVRSNANSRAANQHDHTSRIPTLGKLGPSKATVAWQLPKGPIKKVLVIFEAVDVQPYEFWDSSPSCEQCTGLPEKRKIVMDAIARNYAVLIPHPLDIHSMREPSDGTLQAFSTNSPDIMNILYILAEWKGRIDLQEDVPTVALGVSSGGKILSTLGHFPGLFESIGMMISPGLVDAFKSSTLDYPPTIFVHMPKDTATAEMVYYDRKLLRSKGVPTKEVRWYEHSVTQYWFAELIPGLDQATSIEIHRCLKESKWLDEVTGFLSPDFQNEWFEKAREWKVFPVDLTEEKRLILEDRVFEELNVAYAYHVTLARTNNDLFAWFEGGYVNEVPERVVQTVHPPPKPVSQFKAATY